MPDMIPVDLNKNDQGRYMAQSSEDRKKQAATVRLLTELTKGMESLRKNGGLSLNEAFDGLEN
ncbi:MAG: hypothetical protein ACOX6O_04880 [Christensenellales bacterium]|jgi:hypothetical protein